MKEAKRLSERGFTIEKTRGVSPSIITNKKAQKMNEKWHDLFRDGKRLDRVIRRLEKRFKKTEEDEKIIKLANSITYVTSKKMELVDMVLGVEALLKKNGRSDYAKNYKTVYPEKP